MKDVLDVEGSYLEVFPMKLGEGGDLVLCERGDEPIQYDLLLRPADQEEWEFESLDALQDKITELLLGRPEITEVVWESL